MAERRWLCSPAVFAAEVLSETPDTTVGKATGGMTGMMLGALGGAAQQASGLAEPAYLVKTDDGSMQRFRSPGQHFKPGDQVEVHGIRIEAAH
ncbi:hypothetical protein [Pseudomonas sp. LFM046]|uniref:hypothetical protein n=1 Tax=Pseudomonas sp. LFM046 TaxID=1608357 RepID=UPI0005CFBFE4|nr:hypothetical protein [Pseudomonas sp. LFM046]